MKPVLLFEANYSDCAEKKEDSFKINSQINSRSEANNGLRNCSTPSDMEICQGSGSLSDNSPHRVCIDKEKPNIIVKSEESNKSIGNDSGAQCKGADACDLARDEKSTCQEKYDMDSEKKMFCKSSGTVVHKSVPNSKSPSDNKGKSNNVIDNDCVLSNALKNSDKKDNVLSAANSVKSGKVDASEVKSQDRKREREIGNESLQLRKKVVHPKNDGTVLDVISLGDTSRGSVADIKGFSTAKGKKVRTSDGASEDEFENEVGDTSSEERQEKDEIFIDVFIKGDDEVEEEENKENRRNGESRLDGDSHVRMIDSIEEQCNDDNPLDSIGSGWEGEDSFKSVWNEEKAGFYGTDENIEINEGEESLLETVLSVGETGRSCDGKEGGRDCAAGEGKNAAHPPTEIHDREPRGRKPCIKDGDARQAEGLPGGNRAPANSVEPTGEFQFEEYGNFEGKSGHTKKRPSLDRTNECVAAVKRRKRSSSIMPGDGDSSSPTIRPCVTEKGSLIRDKLDSDNSGSEHDSEIVTEGIYQHKKNNLDESINRVATAPVSLPFIESLRGTIRTLSRSDLEELIVQKLCEVITERSTVGDLRKKAQALEQDQERWKGKVQSLTKQLKEMDMVMKKYMSEVQKQNKERSFQMVAPLRVTRSVGLQVSFTSNVPRLNKIVSNPQPAKMDMSWDQEKTAKQQPSKHLVNSPNQKKSAAATVPPPETKKTPQAQKKQQQQQFSPRQGVNVALQTRIISPPSLVSPSRTLQTQQMNAMSRAKSTVAATEQNNSKIIDLTDDDDRQGGQNSQKTVLQPSITVRPPGQIRVVNHIQSAQVNPTGRVAYLVPATTSTASGSGAAAQSRQLLIATPTTVKQPSTRQLLPSVPPLLYKGSTILQPGAQQSSFVNQPNRSPVAKPLKHPAPLPQPPTNQIQKPNWKLLPPRPALKISKVQTGIVLSWNMTLGPEYEPIASYQLYAYQENNSPPATSLWKKVGDVKALPLPMACTLTQFMTGHKYHFAVRAVDLHSRIGPFSFPGTIVLVK